MFERKPTTVEMEMKRLMTTVLLCAATLAHAEFLDGNKLLGYMRETDYFSKGVAAGYVTGMFDAGASITHCAPQSVTIGQVKDLVNQHLEANPVIRNDLASVILMRLFKQTWPCAKRGTGI